MPNAMPCSISDHDPAVNPIIGTLLESGSHDVPEASRRAFTSIGDTDDTPTIDMRDMSC